MKQNRVRLKTDWKTILGSKRLAQEINQINRILAGTQFIRGGDTILTSDGIMMRAKGTAEDSTHDFKISTFYDEGTPKARVKTGRISSLVPTLGGTALNNDPAPEATLVNGSNYFWLEVDLTQNTPSGYSLPTNYTLDTPKVVVNTASDYDITEEEGYLYLDSTGKAVFRIGSVQVTAGTAEAPIQEIQNSGKYLWVPGAGHVFLENA